MPRVSDSDMKKLMEHWETLEFVHEGMLVHSLRFTGTADEFEDWRKSWYQIVPRCPDFSCCHELMSCGIGHACGDASLHYTMTRGAASDICTDAECIDCTSRHQCIFGLLEPDKRKEYSLSFVPAPETDEGE